MQPTTLPNTLTPAPVTVVRTSSPLVSQNPHTSSVPVQPSVTDQVGMAKAQYVPLGQTTSIAYPMQPTSTQVQSGPGQLQPTHQYSMPAAQYSTLPMFSNETAIPSQANLPPFSLQKSLASSVQRYPNPTSVSLPVTVSTSSQPSPIPLATAVTAQGATYSFSAVPASQAPGSLTASGLPTLPPTISLPAVPPKIRFGPSPFLPATGTS